MNRFGAYREEWSAVDGFDGIYRVSNLGAIYSCRRNRLLSPHKDADGYLRIGLWDGEIQRKYAVHKLVAEAFHADKKNALHNEVAHLDGDRANPRADNLKWVSKVENHSHRHAHGTAHRGEKHPGAKLTNEQAALIRLTTGDRRALARQYGVSLDTITDIRSGRRRARG